MKFWIRTGNVLVLERSNKSIAVIKFYRRSPVAFDSKRNHWNLKHIFPIWFLRCRNEFHTQWESMRWILPEFFLKTMNSNRNALILKKIRGARSIEYLPLRNWGLLAKNSFLFSASANLPWFWFLGWSLSLWLNCS